MFRGTAVTSSGESSKRCSFINSFEEVLATQDVAWFNYPIPYVSKREIKISDKPLERTTFQKCHLRLKCYSDLLAQNVVQNLSKTTKQMTKLY